MVKIREEEKFDFSREPDSKFSHNLPMFKPWPIQHGVVTGRFIYAISESCLTAQDGHRRETALPLISFTHSRIFRFFFPRLF